MHGEKTIVGMPGVETRCTSEVSGFQRSNPACSVVTQTFDVDSSAKPLTMQPSSDTPEAV